MKVSVAGAFPVLMLLAACGEDDGEGGTPDLFLGVSGVVIAVVVAWLIWRALKHSE